MLTLSSSILFLFFIVAQCAPSKAVLDLSPTIFESEVLQDSEAWIVEFHEGEERVENIDVLPKHAYGFARVGQLDCSKYDDFCDDVDDLPLLRVYPYGSEALKKAQAQDTKDAKQARRYAQDSLPNSLAFADATNMDQIVSQAVMTSPSKSVVFMFTEKDEPSSVARALALRFGHVLTFAHVGPDGGGPELMARFNIDELPFVMILAPQLMPGQTLEDVFLSGEQAQFQAVPYGGPSFNFAHLEGWCMLFLAQMGIGDEGPTRSATGANFQTEKTKEFSWPDVQELTPDNFQEVCGGGMGVCVIGFLNADPLPEYTESRNRHITVLEDVLDHFKRESLGVRVGWVDTECQAELAQTFGVTLTDTPTVVVLHVGKLRYLQLIGSFTSDSISKFAHDVLGGKIRSQTVYQIPALEGDCSSLLRASAVEEESDPEADSILQEILEESRKRQEELEAEMAELEKSTKGKKKKSKKSKKSKKAKDEL